MMVMNSYSFGAPVPSVHYWLLNDGASPYANTGSAGSPTMVNSGTVTQDGAFSGISVAGAGAVTAADTADVFDSIFAGSGKRFTILFNFKLASLSADAFLFAKLATSSAERQFLIVARSTGDLDFIWYGALNGSSFRQVRTASAISAGVEYALRISYDGTIATGNGLDRVKIFLNGTAKATTLAGNGGAIHDIIAGPAPISLGAAYSSGGVLQGSPSSGSYKRLEIFNYVA